MKQQFKGFLSGVVVTVLIFTLAIPAVAATAKQINALYSGISVTLDGAKIPLKDAKGNAVEPFIVDGTTYLPVRAVGEALGLSVSFDGATQTVKLETGKAVDKPKTEKPKEEPPKKMDNLLDGSVSHKEYKMKNEKVLVILTNESKVSIPDYEIQLTYYDSGKKPIAVKSDGHDAILPNHSVASYFDMPEDSNGNLVNYSYYSVSGKADFKSRLYTNLTDSLKIESNKGASGVVVSVTNNAKLTVDELEIVIVYSKDGKIVGANESEERDIAPGSSVNMDISPAYDSSYHPAEFDSYDIFVNQAHNFGR